MKAKTRAHLTLGLFSGALFLSAGLMFALQPMVGKMLLPLVGGTPAGWIVTMAFFQVMLLAGYFVAHFLSRFPPRLHGLLYILLLGAGCLFLPVTITGVAGESSPGALDIFKLLTVAVAVPFIAISATSSTLQRLFTATGHEAAGDPYFLYAASNLGSFTGLFLYPLVFEPLWGNALQSRFWFAGFVALGAIALLCLSRASPKSDKPSRAAKKEKPVTGKQRIEWILLSFFPSALLLAVTTHISTDIFSAPMIWVIPLALYLLTFVAAFSRKPLLPYKEVARWHRMVLPLAIGLLCVYNQNLRVTVYAMAFHLLAFSLTALICHMRLAEKRPDGTGRNLTEYYLMMSIGGALGGVLNAFILPVVLDRLVEYPVLMILACLVLPAFREKMTLVSKMMLCFAGFCGLMHFLYVLSFSNGTDISQFNSDMMFADFILFTIAVLLGLNLRTAVYGATVMLLLSEAVFPRDSLLTTRNFYGVIKVFERVLEMKGEPQKAHYMYHGTTTHGIQVMGPKYEKTPTAYFWAGGPVGDIFALYNPKKIAVVGLGAGTMNCYANKDNEFTFLEIDKAVLHVAETQFTFLKACKGKKPPRIIIGDGRLELAKLKGETFNLLALDAFSSDTIPAHLLTLEAVKSYLDRLAPTGMLLFNLSNRYFMLAAPLLRVADQLGLKTRFVLDIPPDSAAHAASSIWLVMARPKASLLPLNEYGWVELAPPPDAPLWTDDHTDMLGVLTFKPSLAPARETK